MKEAIAYAILAVVVIVAIASVGWRNGAQQANAAWQSKWDQHLASDATGTAEAQAEQRAIEAMRQQSINKVTQDAQQAIDRANADAADANSAADGLRDAADRYVDSQGRLASCTTAASQAATAHARLLADVLKRADERAGRLAAVADQAYLRGLSCEQAYDALSP